MLRINSRRSSVKTELSKRGSVRSDNWSGRFDPPPSDVRLRNSPDRKLYQSEGSLSASSIKRNPSFNTPYCLSPRIAQPSVYPVISPVTCLATPASLATYPVVTPSASSFARPSPGSNNYSSMFPSPAHSNYCTAGQAGGESPQT